jgi:hypothetical protein
MHDTATWIPQAGNPTNRSLWHRGKNRELGLLYNWMFSITMEVQYPLAGEPIFKIAAYRGWGESNLQIVAEGTETPEFGKAAAHSPADRVPHI